MALSGDLTPLQWLTRLGQKLEARGPQLDLWDRYYRGDHDLPAGPSQHLETFRRFQAKARTNLCALPVESVVDRLRATGITDGSPSGENDATLFGWWQANRMDARQSTLYRYALKHGESYLIVGKHPTVNRPRWTIESARSVIVETDPADPLVRLAALRVWFDSVSRVWFATVWMPGWRFVYKTTRPYNDAAVVDAMPSWSADSWVRVNAYPSTQAVPVIPFTNGDELSGGQAEFAIGMDVQDRLNLTILNRLTSERYSAFRQRYAVNLDLDEDPVTGEPVNPYKAGSTELWVAGSPERPGDGEVKFGDFQQTDTSQMLRAVDADVKAFMAVTTTPVYYFGDLTNVGADTINAIDSGHISKCQQRIARFSEDFEEAFAVSAETMRANVDLDAAEVTWERPENWNPTQVADLISKRVGAGEPLLMVLQDLGKSPQYVERVRVELTRAQARQRLGGTVPPTE